jgi:hypothetical protein
MDAFTQLALMAKAKRVFESQDTFLSFPVLSPKTYTPEELKFGRPGEMTSHLAELSEFARITNGIPRGVIAPMEEEEYLWTVYGEVLRTAQVAAGDMTPDEQARYEQAMSILYTRSADGMRRDSEALRAYKQHRDAHIKAQEEYKNQQLTAESSEDAAVQTRWRNTDEPRLRQELKRLEEEWLTIGLKAEVEAAQQIEQTCAGRAPSLTWNDWKTSFIADLDTQTGTDLVNYAVTGFSPYDFFDAGGWPRFTLTSAEMTRLAGEAPSELLDVLGGSQPDAGIDRVSFEYRSVAVTRPWFRPALLKSRIWRLPASAEQLSDGSDQSRGRCPAYITAIVFARNVTVERRQLGATPTKPNDLLLNASLLHRLHAAPPTVVRDHRTMVARNPRAGDGLTMRRAAARPLRVAAPAAFAASARPAAAAAVLGPRKPAVSLHGVAFTAMLHAPGQLTAPGPTPPPSGQPTASSSDMTVLAFICKRVPRSPDPDPTLSWR